MLVDDGGAGPASPWDRSPVPAEHQIRGLGPIVLTVQELSRTAFVLTEVMNMRRVRDYAAHGAEIHVFEMGEARGERSPAAELHVLEDKDVPVARQGAGGVHHVAFRTPDEAQYHAWTQRLNELRVPNSGEIDRFYFRSLYFREPNGILFEIATDGPGFATDEPMETLGEKLALPPFLEPRRAAIEAGLKPRNFVGWVERSETDHETHAAIDRSRFRFARALLRRSVRSTHPTGRVVQADQWVGSRTTRTPVGSGSCGLRLVSVASLQLARLMISTVRPSFSRVSAGSRTLSPLLSRRKYVPRICRSVAGVPDDLPEALRPQIGSGSV